MTVRLTKTYSAELAGEVTMGQIKRLLAMAESAGFNDATSVDVDKYTGDRPGEQGYVTITLRAQEAG